MGNNVVYTACSLNFAMHCRYFIVRTHYIVHYNCDKGWFWTQLLSCDKHVSTFVLACPGNLTKFVWPDHLSLIMFCSSKIDITTRYIYTVQTCFSSHIFPHTCTFPLLPPYLKISASAISATKHIVVWSPDLQLSLLFIVNI